MRIIVLIADIQYNTIYTMYFRVFFFLFLLLFLTKSMFAFASYTHERKNKDTDQVCHGVQIISPSPTLAPLIVPTTPPQSSPLDTSSETAPVFAGSTTQAPASPMCTIPFASPNIPVITRIGATAMRIQFWPSTAAPEYEDIEYGYTATNLQFGIILPPTDGDYTITDLAATTVVYARACAFKNGCSSCSTIIDP